MSIAQDSPLQARFDVVSEAVAWQRMPQERPALPTWARMLVQPLPKSTAALLQLDRLHRVDNPLGAVLAGKLRWTVADALDCGYGRRYAEADLRQAGVTENELELIGKEGDGQPGAERSIIQFGRDLTLSAHDITDSQAAALVEQLGPGQFLAIVHTVAFANFQNRLFLGMGVEVEPGGPLPPVELELDAAQQADVEVPARRAMAEGESAASGIARPARADWGQQDFAMLELALNQQQQRDPRVPIPGVERLSHLPPAERAHTEKVIWSRVSVGYQPRLAGGWLRLLRIFRDEAALDRVFSNSMFWVVTRSNECFY